jgi:hypothetical protein
MRSVPFVIPILLVNHSNLIDLMVQKCPNLMVKRNYLGIFRIIQIPLKSHFDTIPLVGG